MTEPSPAAFDHRTFLKTLTGRPGVYRMLDCEGRLLYVGKAKNLKRRVGSYFSRSLNQRIQLMVSQIRAIEITVTHTEAEALILENNLIKGLQPRYNVLLRDDKSYPYIHLTDHAFPRLTYHRGARKGGGRFFGPYPSGGSIRQTLQLLQKLFPVRQCEDSFFRNRSRPCLQYQIKRCTAPCVGLIDAAGYGRDLADAALFLEGRTNEVIDKLADRMEQAADRLEFEQAARFRDQIADLRRIQEKQYVSNEKGDLDILAAACEGGQACVQLFFIRGGRNLGNKAFYPKLPGGQEEADLLSAFLAQYYIGRQTPDELLLSHEPEDREILEAVLCEQSGHRVALRCRPRGERARWLKMADHNARLSLRARLAQKEGVQQRLEALREAFGLEETPERMECFDISHTGGEKTVASCVVFDGSGPLKSDYRLFNIEGIQPGDDYAAMQQALERRYARLKAGEAPLPDILFIDGGKGQLARAGTVLEELGIAGVQLIGVAKGADRKPGLERLFLLGREAPTILAADSPALHLIQQIRDEAHRFAITGHRRRRGKVRTESVLESIPGIGAKRRQWLLKAFGGLQAVSRAGIEDLARVEGISGVLAEQIYEAFHGGGE
ncbi:MAG: excinuclease ABC subunit UvrC [Gammaproteobacteria bacterium]|nr:excinuclease ABC subunit UvrC [Gammaproteobacteria bacterium]MBU1654666.1 excinuclease ABC subunit UvrC [Gammaproteobacteria bacterium]MBU1961389.1 excinuclease ABC subunit UvrC [Gammaproteobacteria bacterium]